MIRCRVFGHVWISGWSPSRNAAGLRCVRCGAEEWFGGGGVKNAGWTTADRLRIAHRRGTVARVAIAILLSLAVALALFGQAGCIAPDIVSVGYVQGGVDGLTNFDGGFSGNQELESDFDAEAVIVSVGWSPTMRRIERNSERQLELLRQLVEGRAER